MKFSMDNLIKTSFMKLIENAGISNRNFVVIKEYGTIKMSEKEVEEISSGSKVSHYIHYHQFNDEVMSGAYEPFLDYISESIKILGIDIGEMFDECKVIFMHRELLKFFFEENYFTRREILLCNEVPYEKENSVDHLYCGFPCLAGNPPGRDQRIRSACHRFLCQCGAGAVRAARLLHRLLHAKHLDDELLHHQFL